MWKMLCECERGDPMMCKKLAALAAVIMLAGTTVLSGCSSDGENSGGSAAVEDTKSEVKLGEYKGFP